MNSRLQQQAQAFIETPVPSSIEHVPGSIAENCISQYAKSGQVDLSPEFAEILKLFLFETKFSAEHSSGEEGEYFQSRYQILSQIVAELKCDSENDEQLEE